MKSSTASKDLVSLKRPVLLGVVTELPAFAEPAAVWLREYLSSLSSRQLARVTAIWTPEQKSTETIINEYFRGAIEPFYGFCEESIGARPPEGSDQMRRSLETMVGNEGCQVDALVLLLSPASHSQVLRKLFALEGFNKHILSADSGFCRTGGDDLLAKAVQSRTVSLSSMSGRQPPSLESSSLESARKQADATDALPRAWHWFVVGSLRFEPAVKALCEMIPEIGATVGGTLSGSIIPKSGPPGIGSGVSMLELLIAYIALLRKVFGELQSVVSEGSSDSSLASIEEATIGDLRPELHVEKRQVAPFQVEAGSVKFLSGASCAITILPSSPASIFNLTVHGTLGHLSLSWDRVKQCFELQRSLKHFEHPSLHPSLGHAWCFAGWLEAIFQDFGPNLVSPHPIGSCYETLVDVTIAKAMLETRGAIVNFHAVPLSSSSHVS